MAEWISLYSASKISGFSTGYIAKLIRRGSVPADNARRSGNRWEITTSEAERLRQTKRSNSDWTCNELPEPADAVYVADPLGLYLGFSLAPDAARRLLAIRRNKRIYGDTWARNRQLVNALMSVREYIGDG